MANTHIESLSKKVNDSSVFKPRIFLRSDVTRVDRSSPREPYLSFTIGPNPLFRLIIRIWSHEDGCYDAQHETDHPNANSHTSFALGIIPESLNAVRPPEEPYLCEIQRNNRASIEKKCHILEWRLNTPIEADESDQNEAQGWLESISSGSLIKVGVFPLARYAGWVNVVHRVEVELYDNSDEDIGTKLDILTMSLAQVYEQTRSIEDLTRSVELTEKFAKFLEGIPNNDPYLGACLSNLGFWLAERYRRTQSRDDLKRAIEMAQESIKAAPNDDYGLASYLAHFGNWIYMRHEQTQSMDDLSRSIEATEQAIKMTLYGDPHLTKYLEDLAARLSMRYQHTRSVGDLTRQIEIHQQAVEATTNDHSKLAEFLDNLGSCLADRYKQTRRINDMESAIEVLDKVVKMVPSCHPDLARYLNILGDWLRAGFEATGSMEYLERAIKMNGRAIEITPDTDHEALIKYLSSLGTCFGSRSYQTHSTDDLNTAIELLERVTGMLPKSYPTLAVVYSNLGNCFSNKSDRIGSTDLLTRAIECHQKAVGATHINDLRVACLNNLGQSLAKRHAQTGSMDDLTNATEALKKAVEAAPNSHQCLALVFSNLAGCFNELYDRLGSAVHLTEAIKTAEKAIKVTPHSHITLASKLTNLGNYLNKQYKRTMAMEDLTRAIEVSQQAVGTSYSANLAICWYNLGIRVFERYERTGSMDDLMRAIEAAQNAVEATPHGHTSLARYLGNLGTLRGHRYAQTREETDRDAQLSAYVKSWHCRTSPPSDRIRSARYAAKINASREEWDEAYHLLREAVLLLPKVSPRSLTQFDMQSMLGPISGLATDAAAMAINAGKSASEVLSIIEMGRGVIAGLLIDTRGDLSNLRGTHPSLADRFVVLRNELDLPSQDNDSMAEFAMVNRRHQANREFDEVIEEIRTQDGFHDFLQSPSTETLMAAAKPGPIVIINVSSLRCDAILVECETVRLLEFPGFTLERLPEHVMNTSDFKHHPWPILEWLWTTVCRPCLDALGFTEALGDDAQWPHIWWIPTSGLAQFPLHAAGIYAPGSKETVLDRVVSSYALSIKALQHGRQKQGGLIAGHGQQNAAVLVAMEETEGQMSLPNATTEIDKVRALCQLLDLETTTPPRRKADILEYLKKCTILHFAGHGEFRRDPSQSFLLLDDWKTNPLTVGDLRESWLQESPAFLAYLSACSTGSNVVRDLWDEAIHLVSAFQLAGFRHVVGTLWEVSDPHCVDVATVLYKTLCEDGMTDEAVSYGLHRAVRKLREDSSWGGTRRDAEREDKRPITGSNLNTYWIPYIHYGA